MAFNPGQPVTRTPTEIGTIEVTLFYSLDPDDSPYGARYAHFELSVDDQNGETMGWRRGDLTPHLTQGQIDQLIAFMDMLRAKAESEILP